MCNYFSILSITAFTGTSDLSRKLKSDLLHYQRNGTREMSCVGNWIWLVSACIQFYIIWKHNSFGGAIVRCLQFWNFSILNQLQLPSKLAPNLYNHHHRQDLGQKLCSTLFNYHKWLINFNECNRAIVLSKKLSEFLTSDPNLKAAMRKPLDSMT